MRLRLAIAGLIVATAGAASVRADRIPVPWESVVAYADFVGVVECETAGGIVARYRVMDSWKGPGNGSELVMGRRVDVWGAWYPLSLVGERFFVTASRECGSWTLPPPPGLDWGFVPLWWRGLERDYVIDYDPVRLPFRRGATRGILDTVLAPRQASVDSFRVMAIQLLQHDENWRELAALRAAATEVDWLAREDRDPTLGVCTSDACRATRSDSLTLVVSQLLRLEGVSEVLFQGGGRETLRQLDAGGGSHLSRDLRRSIRNKIRCRLGLGLPELTEPPKVLLEDREVSRRVLLGGIRAGELHHKFEQAFMHLTEAEPDIVAKYLATSTQADSSMGYVLGSYFLTHCGARARYIQGLLSAENTYVRVAAAVYLQFEDSERAELELKRMTSLPGDPGAWAALTLARRGHKEYVERALDVLRHPASILVGSWNHRVLQARIVELLSNSAAASGLEFPTVWNPETIDLERESLPVFIACSTWWQQYQSRITLRDPWLATLAAKQVD